jgi:hypothetical protein
MNSLRTPSKRIPIPLLRERRVQQRVFIIIASSIVEAMPKDIKSAQQYAVAERSYLTVSIPELIVYL